MRCIAYLRVSSTDIFDQQMGFNYQRKMISDFVHKNNYEVVKFIQETGLSTSGKFEIAIVNELKKYKVDALVCTSMDRIARKVEDFKRLQYLLKIAGVKLIFADTEHEVEPLIPFDKAVESIKEAICLLVKEEHSRRIKRGIKRKKEQHDDNK